MTQEENRPAETGETTAVPQAETAQKLEQFSADVLLLTDIVSSFSDREQLVTRDELLAAFTERAPSAAVPDRADLEAEASRSLAESLGREEKRVLSAEELGKKKREDADLPTTREQRRILTRRELLRAVLSGEFVSAAAVAAESEKAAEEAPVREITPEYFDQVLAAALEGDSGVVSFTAWDGRELFHYKPLLSSSYARMLSARDNKFVQVRDTIRENSERYPRPVPIELFEGPPFDLTPDELQAILKEMAENEETQDIRFTQTSVGTLFLYSNKWLEDDYADFLAEDIDVGPDESP